MDYGDRPGSRSNVGSRSGLRTGGGLRTANGPANYSGVGMNTNVSVTDRPVTNHGLGGMRVGTAGPKRQVQDTSYYIGLLRGKCSEISNEVNRLKKECDKFQSDNNSYLKYERQYEDLIKLVRNLEGKLADYNLAMDKARDSTDPEDVRAYQQQLAFRNSQEKKTMDAIFLERQRCEEGVRKAEEEIGKIRSMEEYKVNQLSQNERERYHVLAEENSAQLNTLNGRRGELDNICKRIKQGEMALKNDHLREEWNILQRQLTQLSREKENLETELEVSKLNPAEARARMLEKVKADNAKIQNMTKELERMEDAKENKRQQLRDLQAEVEELRGGLSSKNSGCRDMSSGTDDEQKYEVLFARDQEMTKFLESFDNQVVHELEEQKKAQKMIVGLLEHTSQHILRENNLPNNEQFSEMQDSLNFKKKQLANSASTQEQLQKELEKRKGELEKVNTLDSKIEVELSSLTTRIKVMNEEMVHFVKLDDLRNEADRTREELLEQKKEYQHRRDSIKSQVNSISQKYEKRKTMLADNETARILDGLEQKLRHYEQNIFHLNEFIIEKELESNFQSEREECGRFIDELNALHIQAAAN